MAAIAVLYRSHWKRWLVYFVLFLLAVSLILGPVYAALGITRLGAVESAALPLQQVARAVKNGAPLTEEQRQKRDIKKLAFYEKKLAELRAAQEAQKAQAE